MKSKWILGRFSPFAFGPKYSIVERKGRTDLKKEMKLVILHLAWMFVGCGWILEFPWPRGL